MRTPQERNLNQTLVRLTSPRARRYYSGEKKGFKFPIHNVFSTREITMVRKILVLSVLAMSLAAPSTYAQTAPASAVDPASIQAIKDMGAFLQTLKRFQVSTELTGERVLADGQKLQHTATADMDVERPNQIRVKMHSARSERELVYDGKTVTLYAPAQ